MTFRIYIILGLICLFSTILTVLNHQAVPYCTNADEAAFGYNAYSILKTGRDEYGVAAPIRLKSFGDYKMPLYSYLSVPFVATLGLNDNGARGLNILLSMMFPIVIFLLSYELFKNSTTALTAAALTAGSLALHIVARQAHEGYLTALLIALSTWLLVRFLNSPTWRRYALFMTTVGVSLFSYQSTRIFAAFFVGVIAVYVVRRKMPVKWLILSILIGALLAIPDIVYTPARVGNLLFFKNPGLGLKTQQLREEGGSKIIYNKATVAAADLLGQHLSYYSPQFLATNGDENYRFGYAGMSPMTYIEYVFIFIGLYFIFRKRDKHNILLTALLLVTPLAGSLSWAGSSITRTLFIFPLATLLSSYGFVEFLKNAPKSRRSVITLSCVAVYSYLFFYSWNFYLNHYNKRAAVIVSQQCGYKQMVDNIRPSLESINHVYISKERGEPYIFLLYYLKYDPSSYQRQAHLSAPDQYGFGQVENFDKFTFSLPSELPTHSIIIGTPEDFASHPNYHIQESRVEKVIVGTNQMFWIYRT